MDKRELQAKQNYSKVLEEVQKTEEQLFALKEIKRRMATDIHNEFHLPNEVLIAGN